jgi:uncharacterized membrane protein
LRLRACVAAEGTTAEEEGEGRISIRSLGSDLIERLKVFDGSDLADRPLPDVLSRTVSRPGEITGLLFAALTLFPSMLPKNWFMQGAVLGITFMVGYALGAAWQWTWQFLELPAPNGSTWRSLVLGWYVLLGILLASNLWRHIGWQNSVRETFGMTPITPVGWFLILPIAFVVAGMILIIGRALRKVFDLIIRWFDRHLPRRLAMLLGGLAFWLLLWGLWSEVLVDGFFAAANRISAPVDARTDPGIAPPRSSRRSGGPSSLVGWETLGRQGRNFVATGPTVDDLNAYHGEGAMEPIRVYVGLQSAHTVGERAALLLDELVRTGAFEREVLVVATTTGTGFLDPNAIDALEFVTNGDVAVAGAQYSYLPSPVSLLADADEVTETARAVFDTIHEYWADLPPDDRPAIYLYGLSLGSHGVESILSSIEIINEPVDGALMVGPPFVNELWRRLVANRDPGTTAVTPVYEGGHTVRFTNQANAVHPPDRDWGDTRILYLQHASDPVVFFTPDLLLERPDWLDGDLRGAEISESFRWIPFVTMWQVLTDLAVANSVPEGFGHVYSMPAHADAWAAVIEPEGWNEAESTRLREFLGD